ncbi:hypothetical protein Tco_1236364 [Tanacetum coccineum]
MGYVKNHRNSHDKDEGSSFRPKRQVKRRPKSVLSNEEDSYVTHTRTVKRRRMSNVYISDDEETTSVSESSDDSFVVSYSDETISSNEEHNWEFEADMLVDFGKSPELCMSAVCALFRQQTAEERRSKVTNLDNKRGFSKTDSHRFVTFDRLSSAVCCLNNAHTALMQSSRDLPKSASISASNSQLCSSLLEMVSSEYDTTKWSSELSLTLETVRCELPKKRQESDEVDLEDCMSLAFKYSKELFALYKSQRDPYFAPH